MASKRVSGVLFLCHGHGINPKIKNEHDDVFLRCSMSCKSAAWAFKVTEYFVVPYNPHPQNRVQAINKIKNFFIILTLLNYCFIVNKFLPPVQNTVFPKHREK